MESLVSPSTEPLTPNSSNLPVKGLRALVSVQLTAGILAIVANIAAIVLDAGSSYVSYGIWCGILYIVTSSYGLTATRNKQIKSISVFFTLTCIVVFLFLAPLYTWTITGISQDVGYRSRWDPSYDPHNYKVYRVVCNGCILLCGVIVSITSLWSGIITWMYINNNYISMDRTEPQEMPENKTEWYMLTLPSGEQQLVHCSQLGKLQGEPITVKVVKKDTSAEDKKA